MPLVNLRAAIVEAWEAITPATDPGRLYRYAEKIESGTSSHRTFYFRNLSGGGISEQGATRHMVRHSFEAVVQLYLPERNSVRFDQPYREFQMLAAAVHLQSVSRVVVPRVVSYRVEDELGDDRGDVDLVLTIEAATKEETITP